MRGSPLIAAARRRGGASLLLAAIAVVVALAPPSLADALQYDRAAILSGQVYRLITCHWTHWGTEHLVWDVATFVMLGTLCERRSRPRFAAALLLALKAVPSGILLLLPNLQFYRGLSALDCTLFALLAADVLQDSIRERRRSWTIAVALCFAGLVIKTGIEAFTGSTVFVDSAAAGFAPVPLAHLLGLAAGLASALGYAFFFSPKRNPVLACPAPRVNVKLPVVGVVRV
jgi:rhomboid family GlyGly-CTERM serine protease